MGDFFRGWRRKMGSVMLIAALAISVGWMRSVETTDIVNLPIGNDKAIACSSSDGVLVWRAGWNEDNPWNELDWQNYTTVNYRLGAGSSRCEHDYHFERPLPTGEGDIVDWVFISNGFGFGKTWSRDTKYCQQLYVITPYWMADIPIIFLSAFLLLSKPSLPTKSHQLDPKSSGCALSSRSDYISKAIRLLAFV